MMCWYHPTTIALIDDDKDFLKIFNDQLELPNCFLFDSPANAIETLVNQKQKSRLQHRIVEKSILIENDNITTHDQYAFCIKLHDLHKEIYSHQRFNEISVLIVDYHMGDINGVDLCEKLTQHPAKKILLTGSADKEQIAIEAFNNGVIHRFVSKSDVRFPVKLKQAVSLLKETYFKEASAALIPYMSLSSTQLLTNPAYMNFIKSIQTKYNIVEYYLLDLSGSVIFLNDQGDTLMLIVKSERELFDYEQIAIDSDGSDHLIQAIKSRKKIPFFFSEEDYQQPISNWEEYFYPANSLPGLNSHYYSLVKNPAYLDREKIFPYTKFSNFTAAKSKD